MAVGLAQLVVFIMMCSLAYRPDFFYCNDGNLQTKEAARIMWWICTVMVWLITLSVVSAMSYVIGQTIKANKANKPAEVEEKPTHLEPLLNEKVA